MLALGALSAVLIVGTAFFAVDPGSSEAQGVQASGKLVSSSQYQVVVAAARPWTEAELAAAVPLMPKADMTKALPTTRVTAQSGTAGGRTAGSPQVLAAAPVVGVGTISGGVAPASSSYSYPAPFTNYALFGAYTRYPNSTIGTLFFNQKGGSFRCSAAAAGPSDIFTAGHCVHAGNNDLINGWSTNMFFYPSWDNGAANPNIGSFPVTTLTTTSDWAVNGNLERDLGTGQTDVNFRGQSLGTVTGWLGVAWNFPNDGSSPGNSWAQMGYPAQTPFNGNKIRVNVSSFAYNLDTCPLCGTPPEFAVGSINNGGASGGPFIRSYGWPPPAIAAGGNWINGVHSFTRVDSMGNRFQEMASPYFDTFACDVYYTYRSDVITKPC